MEYILSLILSSLFSFYIVNKITISGLLNILGIFGAIFSIILLITSFLKIQILVYLKKIDEKKKIEKLEKEFSENIQSIDYYREAFDKYPPAIIFILLGKNNFDDLLVSITLSLEQKGYLKIENNNIVVLEKETEELMPHEKYFLSKYNELFLIVQNNKKIFFTSKHDKLIIKEFKQLIYDDAVSLNLMTNINSSIKIPAFTNVIIILGALLGYIPALHFFGKYSILYFLVLFILVVILLDFDPNKKNPEFARTELGLDMCNKLYGLKKFIIDFSNLNDNTIRELEMWKSYKISTILFNINGNLNNEINILFNNFASSCKTSIRIGKMPTIVYTTVFVLLAYFLLLVPLLIMGNCEPIIIIVISLSIGIFLFIMNSAE